MSEANGRRYNYPALVKAAELYTPKFREFLDEIHMPIGDQKLYDAMRQRIADVYRVPVGLMFPDNNRNEEAAMRESGFTTDENALTTKKQLRDLIAELRDEHKATAERSARRERVIRELGYLTDDMGNTDPLPYHIHDLVCKRMNALVQEGLSHTKPGA